MTAFLLLAAALAAGSGETPELCAGTVRPTELEMQIQESDLGQKEAVAASEALRDMVRRGVVDGESNYGALNQLKILHGHVLLQQALADRKNYGADSVEAKDSQNAFCSWLVQDGFWYD